MTKGSKLTATALATLLAAAPVGAFAWTGNQSSANPGTSSQAANQTAPLGTAPAPQAEQPQQNGQLSQQNGQLSQQNEQLSQNTVAEMQQKLQQNGFYQNGHVDGIMGPQTEHALRSFQQTKGLAPNGQPDSQTLAALGVNQQPNSGQNTGQDIGNSNSG